MFDSHGLAKFNIEPEDIDILDTPQDFYETLKNGISNASRRIVIASLYLGSNEEELVALLASSLRRKKDLKVTILLDYFRGNRMDKNQSSLTILEVLKREFGERFNLSMFHSPNVGWLKRNTVPPRFIEAFGLQHMKGYLFDDTLIVSGANLNLDYFTNRQDRYLKVNSNLLSDYFCDLMSKVAIFSYTLGPRCNLLGPQILSGTDCSTLMNEFIQKWVLATESVEIKDSGTFICPTLQMKTFGITQDELVMTKLLNSATFNDTIKIATSYFNLPHKYQDIIWKSKANFEILTSSPEANGFFNSKGVSKYIPHAYSYLETKFLNRCLKSGKEASVVVQEYSRSGWTWHGKGIWWERGGTFLTAIGSSNMNYRSLDRDLELQFYLRTDSLGLQRKIRKNLIELYRYSQPISLKAIEKRKSSWILKLAAESLKRFM